MLTVSIPFSYAEKRYTGRERYDVTVHFFGKSGKVLKNTGKNIKECYFLAKDFCANTSVRYYLLMLTKQQNGNTYMEDEFNSKSQTLTNAEFIEFIVNHNLLSTWWFDDVVVSTKSNTERGKWIQLKDVADIRKGKVLPAKVEESSSYRYKYIDLILNVFAGYNISVNQSNNIESACISAVYK